MRLRSFSLRAQMAVFSAAALTTTVLAAGALVWALGAANWHVERLASAQRRLELISAIPGRVGDYGLSALQASEAPKEDPARLARARDLTRQAFYRADAAIGEDVASLSDETEKTLMAGRSRLLSHLRARFDVLDRQVTRSIEAARAGQDFNPITVKVALDTFAVGFSPILGEALGSERAATQEAQAAMADLRKQLTFGAVAAVFTAAVVAILLYLVLARPLARRIDAVAAGASAIARGRFDTRLAVRGRDELSLVMARFNRMAAQLARREARLLADQQRLQEIVDQKTAELRDANLSLTETDRARRRFFTDVSHELRTPLTVILGEAEVTLRSGNDPEGVRTSLRTIQARARRLHRRVEDLLRIARSETGQIEMELAPVETGAILADALEGVLALARAAKVDVTIAADEENFVEGDREWLRQVVEGLLSNAIRYSAPDSKVSVTSRRRDGMVEIAVADEGPGIANADLPHLFDRFYRGSTEQERTGYGIGLALAKWVVERHQGLIFVENRSGQKGTVVRMRLPLMAHEARAVAWR